MSNTSSDTLPEATKDSEKYETNVITLIVCIGVVVVVSIIFWWSTRDTCIPSRPNQRPQISQNESQVSSITNDSVLDMSKVIQNEGEIRVLPFHEVMAYDQE